MIVYPAMDLMDGRVVRLRQGRFDDSTVYSDDPAAALEAFAEAGVEWAHVVDLDGARAGRPVQHELIAELATTVPLRLQVAGGFRERDQLARMFEAGVARVVIGSLAVKQPEAVRGFLDEFGPDRIALSLDVRIVDDTPMVAISGWAEDSRRTLWDIAALYPAAQHLLLTDIGCDGMLQGPNFALYAEAAQRLPHLRIQASGGISSLGDLERLSTDGAIVGKALWEGRIALEEALGLARA
ncbi:MAG: 1-(5-phosphoribosyl)-5-[(5-phosphoribosylamino)methylideneamino] imidazole-4-carboxamide isomerase [Pseudomonadota bacterium]|nr:1-(5-phosphoribosyl)-5-[(5-phosphoribosylamino)methylideneamino] imidazole-4-carboxamide isomerase [Pseudomonadota bacterium]